MNDIGERIAELRTKKGLTQKDLGSALNVTAQAVSKWENGQSEPDIDTLRAMCELFGVTMDELVSGKAKPAPTPASAPAAAATDAPQARVIIGYCDGCKKPLYHPDEYEVKTYHRGRHRSIQRTYCKECVEKEDIVRHKAAYSAYKTENKKGFGWGGVGGAATLGIMLASLLSSPSFETGAAIAVSIVIGLGMFAFIMQVFWGGAITDVFLFFVHSFKMPGVIFTLDIGGLIFLIVVKILFAALSVILSALLFLVGTFVVCPVVALLMLPFTIPNRVKEGRELKSASDAACAREDELKNKNNG